MRFDRDSLNAWENFDLVLELNGVMLADYMAHVKNTISAKNAICFLVFVAEAAVCYTTCARRQKSRETNKQFAPIDGAPLMHCACDFLSDKTCSSSKHYGFWC